MLADLLQADRAALASAIRIETPAVGQVIATRAHPAAEIWFPLSGVVALTVTDHDGRGVEAGIIGPEGCVGLESLFQHMLPLADAWVQIGGPMAAIPVASLRTLVAAHPLVQPALSRFLFSLSAQCLQTIACNRLHTLEQRCCRWLLMVLDRTGDPDLPLTQEGLATLLGSGRPRVNAVLASLERAGLLQRSRGRIRLRSRAGLTARACECYRLLARHGEGILRGLPTSVA